MRNKYLDNIVLALILGLLGCAILTFEGCKDKARTPVPPVISIPDASNETVKIYGQRGITIVGKKFQGIRAKNTPVGIHIRDSHDIVIDGVVMDDIRNSDNAHCILVECRTTCKNITIKNSTFTNMDLGKSECIALHNVDGFLIQSNKFEDMTNIAIDILGGEGVGKDGTDWSRNGVVEKNHVVGVNSPHAWAPAIYCDGCRNTVIRQNIVEKSQMGIEVASENDDPAMNVTVENNIIRDISKVGLSLGSYKKSMGGVKGCTVKGNVFEKTENKMNRLYNLVECP